MPSSGESGSEVEVNILEVNGLTGFVLSSVPSESLTHAVPDTFSLFAGVGLQSGGSGGGSGSGLSEGITQSVLTAAFLSVIVRLSPSQVNSVIRAYHCSGETGSAILVWKSLS